MFVCKVEIAKVALCIQFSSQLNRMQVSGSSEYVLNLPLQNVTITSFMLVLFQLQLKFITSGLV